jgi:hypothetical protein
MNLKSEGIQMAVPSEQDKQKAADLIAPYITSQEFGVEVGKCLVSDVAQTLADAREEGVKAEREKCAKTAEAEQDNIKTEDAAFHRGHAFACHLVAAAIRGEK